MDGVANTVARARWRRLGTPAGAGVLGAVVGAAAVSVAAVDPGLPPLAGPGALAAALALSGGLAGAYLMSAAGLGWGVLRLAGARGDAGRWRGTEGALAGCLGLALLLWASHALGMAGWLSGDGGVIAAGAALVPGLVLAAFAARAHGRRVRAGAGVAPPAAALVVSACAGLCAGVMVASAATPPGSWWPGEARGFDALSYHLRLPVEWASPREAGGAGRLRPVAHNVYSFLPSYMEAAFLHLGALAGAGRSGADGRPLGADALGGAWLAGAQLLHAGTMLLAAWATAGVVRAVSERHGLEARRGAAGAAIAGAVLLATAWTVIAGSLAYNEGAVMACTAGGMLAPLCTRLPRWARAAAVGVLAGGAVSAKPTAAFLVVPALGLWLAATEPARAWARLALPVVAGGLVMVMPWVLRNALATGNPAFPSATGVFGLAHWSAEQHERFAGGHREDGTLGARMALALDPAGAPGGQARGVLHPQWLAFFPAGALAFGALALGGPRLRGAGLALAAGAGVGLASWLMLTHVQSRFLMPLAVPCACAIGLACASVRGGGVIGALVVTVQGAGAWWLVAPQLRERPATLLVAGPGVLTGSVFAPEWAGVPEPGRRAYLEQLGAWSATNLACGDGVVYLLGDSTPLYLRCRVRYHTTWDTSPLGRLMRAHPGDGAAWAHGLAAEGVTHVLVNFGELERLRRDGWYDPLVTPEAVRAWLPSATRVVAAWPESGRALLRLVAEGRLDGAPGAGAGDGVRP